MEQQFGHDFSGIRIHDDGRAAASARSVGALAYAVGQHIVFENRQYAPRTLAGMHLLAHELAHTIQDSGGSSLHRQLKLGDANDSNEYAADQAANAIVRGERARVAPTGSGVVRRQMRECTAHPGSAPNQRRISCPDDGDYRVTLTLSDEPARPETRVTVNPGWNDQRIWLDIGVCRGGTQVTIRPLIDLPEAFSEVVANLVAGSPLLNEVSITPGLTFTIVQNRSFTFTVGPTVTVDQEGLSGVGISLGAQTEDADVRVDATYNPRSEAGFINLTLRPGSSQPTVDCHSKGNQYAVFTCERISHVRGTPAVPPERQPEWKTVYVFFEYASDRFRNDLPLPEEDVRNLIGQGYEVAAIHGFTSPEGPRGTRNMPRFEGNDLLALDRANAAKRWLQSGEVCPDCNLRTIIPEGEGELPSMLGSHVPEAEGRAMEERAIDEFLGRAPGSNADPLAPSDPVERTEFENLTFREQRERAFKTMRRAAIVFKRMVTTREGRPGREAHDEFERAGCPRRVIDAARRDFGINILTGARVPRSRGQ